MSQKSIFMTFRECQIIMYINNENTNCKCVCVLKMIIIFGRKRCHKQQRTEGKLVGCLDSAILFVAIFRSDK